MLEYAPYSIKKAVAFYCYCSRYGQCFQPKFIPCILIILIISSSSTGFCRHFSKFQPFSPYLTAEYEGLNGLCIVRMQEGKMQLSECTTFHTHTKCCSSARENSGHKYSFHMSTSRRLITFSFCCCYNYKLCIQSA